MPIPVNQPAALGLFGTQSLVGAKTAVVPNVAAGALLPVIVYGDLSKSIATELVEARGTVSFRVSPVAGFNPVLVGQVLAPGGAVIESIVAACHPQFSLSPGTGHHVCILTRGPSTPLLVGGAGSIAQSLNLGGVDATMLWDAEEIPNANLSARLDAAGMTQRTGFPILQPAGPPNGAAAFDRVDNLRFFVSPGWFFAIVLPLSAPADVWAVWRELGDIQGLP